MFSSSKNEVKRFYVILEYYNDQASREGVHEKLYQRLFWNLEDDNSPT